MCLWECRPPAAAWPAHKQAPALLQQHPRTHPSTLARPVSTVSSSNSSGLVLSVPVAYRRGLPLARGGGAAAAAECLP